MPTSSLSAVRSAVRNALADVPAGSLVGVACSGGADSLALVDAAAAAAKRGGFTVVGITVDHRLQEGSAKQAERACAQMLDLGAHDVVSVAVDVVDSGSGPEDAARQARYDALHSVAAERGLVCVLLGHTLDDQAETVLMGLTRGSGARSLAGMRPAFEVFRRPLLSVRRSDTEAACHQLGVEFWSDPHNEFDGYTRVRVRRSVLPVLAEQLGDRVYTALARTAEQLSADADFLDSLAARALDAARVEGGLSVKVLSSLDVALRRRVLRMFAVEAGVIAAEFSFDHTAALDKLVVAYTGQKWVDLPGHCKARRVKDVLSVSCEAPDV